ncbi:hypothetical protein BDQ17DRAFT_1543475 [Cyathus striatus]|nr:hypothetical protein BDQ17DRAFT_1543475 [Cyathus striatus]
MEIVGRHLVLVLSWYNNVSKPDNHLYVLDWIKGDIKLHITRPYGTYSSIVHITEHIFVLPNARQFTLEFWRIPKKPGEPTPTVAEYVLGLPRLNVGRIVGSISCRGEPNPVGEPYDPGDDPSDLMTALVARAPIQAPFIPDPMESIIIFNIRILPTLPPFFGLGIIGNTFTFFVHRRALFDLFLRRHGVGVDLESLGSPSSTKANVDELEEDDDATETASPTPSPSPEPAADLPPIPPSPSTTPATPSHPPGPEPVPFEAWAPRITRWLNSDVLPTRWITTTCGQRCILIANQAVAQEGTRGFPWVVLDFNPSRIRRQLRKEARRKRPPAEGVVGGGGDAGGGRWAAEQSDARTWIVSQAEEINSVDAFSVRSESEGIRTALPYVATASSESFNFEGVLMDEERILGINTDMLDRIQSVRVHYFG